MLGGSCSPCCKTCPDYGIFEAVQAVYADVSYSYRLMNLSGNEDFNISFDGVYALPITTGGWSTNFFLVDGFGAFRLVAQLTGSLGSRTGLNFRCERFATIDVPTVGSVGLIGIAERPCGAGFPGSFRALSVGLWSADFSYTQANPLFNVVGLYEYTYTRDGETPAFYGQYAGTAPESVRIDGAASLGLLINSCQNDELIGIGTIGDENPFPQTTRMKWYASGLDPDNEPVEQLFDESLTVRSLEADFGSFRQNMLMSVSPPYWRNRVGEPSEVTIRGFVQSGSLSSASFTNQQTPCVALTPPP